MFNCKALIARKSRTTALLLMFFTSPLLADDAATTSATPTAPAATPPYTLFNPVPADQLRSMDTDRPNVTNTPHTVDAGHLQIETGFIDYAYDRSRFDGDTIRSNDLGFAESDFRLGVLSNLELNAVIDPYQLDQQRDEKTRRSVNADGFGDTIAGAKFNLWGDQGSNDVWKSALAIQPQFKFPSARNNVGNGHFEFSIEFPFLINLPAGVHLGEQTGAGLERNTANTGDVTGFQNSISIDRVIVSNLDVYLEYASDVTTEKHVETVQSVDVGATYPLNDNIVLDTGFAFGAE